MAKMFWEDVNQANERLANTYVMYGDDIYHIDRCENASGTPSAYAADPIHGNYRFISLEDDAWHNFHKLPPMGYVNVMSYGFPMAVLLTRLPERSRSHGIKANRVSVAHLAGGAIAGSPINFVHIVNDSGYRDNIRGAYPTARQILDNLDEGQSAAFHPSYAISKDDFGIFRLFRKHLMVGVIEDSSVRYTKVTDCYREELEQTESFNIREVNE